ncbi:alcohol oxidase [Daedaleopsis nitida]|nr:alcohol oxidase [Daedaleopsis nitida]
MLIFLFLVLVVGTSQSLATLFESPIEELLKKNYDIIIVGAGAGGAVMASRLSEDPCLRILLIEAGGSDFTDINISVPGLAFTLAHSQFDWNYTTTPQPGLNNRSVGYPRGFVLGGSTAINIMTYSRGTRDDWDRFSRVIEDDRWSWDKMLPFISKVDKMTAPPDGHNVSGQFDPAIHNAHGIVNISTSSVPLPIDTRVLEASHQLQDYFPFNPDYNSGDTIGISWTQSTISCGRRVTAASSYLARAFDRSNLDILVNTRVTKLLPIGEASGSGLPDMRGVQFSEDANGTAYTMYASKEVILSAGSINTPQLLMLSGIGNAAHLSSKGIKPLVNLPIVGTNLQDHVYLPNSWLVNSDFTLDDVHRNATLTAELLEVWKKNGTGLLSLAADNQFGWLHTNPSVFSSLRAKDPSAGPTSANFELIFIDNFVSKRMAVPTTGRYITVVTNVVSPSSRGNLSLACADPFDPPLSNPNLLGTEVDLAIMRSAIKAARAFMAAPAWSDYIISEFGAFGQAQTDDELDAYIRDNADTVDHPVGTVAMGKTGALDAELRVKGTVGLRVVDASAFPYVPSGHTQGPTYILAERAAELVRASLRT